MTKPVIVTRAGKGSALTFVEGDANFTNLQNATITVAGDSGTSQSVDLNGTLTISGGTGLSSVAGATDTVTLNLDNTAVTAGSYTLSNITVDAQGRITSAGNGGTSPTMTLPAVNNTRQGYTTTATAAGTTTLTVNSNYLQFFTGTTTQTLQMPAPQTMTVGMQYLVVNNSTGTVSVIASNSAATATLIAGLAVLITCVDITAGGGASSWAVETVGFSGVTGTGNAVLATSATLVTPVLGTPASGNLSNCTADGTNGVGFRVIPSAGAEKSSSYTLATSDRGEFVQVASGGSITVPNSTFAAGDVVVIYNNHTAAITITLSTSNAYIAGTNTNKTSVSLATRGVCNILFVSATVAILTGNIT